MLPSTGRTRVKTFAFKSLGPAHRLCEFVVALLALVIVFPVMFTCAILVKLSGPGPVMLRLACLDEAGRTFHQLRFRTVHMDARARRVRLAFDTHNADGAAGLTGIGAFLIDSGLNKLPQLLNILAGHMSFFGPRAVTISAAVAPMNAAKPGLFRQPRLQLRDL